LLNYYLAVIYKANKMFEETKTIKEELLLSSYELGPIFVQKINNL
jgi:hypothetical protein